MLNHIAFLMPALRGGGVQRQYINLAREFLRRGLAVDMILLETDSAYADLPAWNLVDLGTRRISASLPALNRTLRTLRPDALISAQTPLNALALISSSMVGKPPRVMVTEHNHLTNASQNTSRLGDRMRPLMVRWLYPRADWVVSVSEGVADDLSRAGRIPRERIQVIYNSLDLDDIQRKTIEPVEHPWFKKKDIPVILAVGRMYKQKNYPVLLNAFAKLRAKRETRLLILGEGEERPALQEQVELLGLTRDVDMPGFAPNPFAYMARSNLLALSSEWEGFAIVLTEALACGTPVVSTDCPSGPREILVDGKFGRLVPVGDVDALAVAMEATLDSPPPRALLLSRAQDFSVEHVADAYLDVMGMR